MTKFTEDDYCDIYKKKICDNCGKCLEMDGVDIKAIKIEDIAKTVEENKILEEEYKNTLEEDDDIGEDFDDKSFDDYDELKDAYKKFAEENNLGEEYEDAFDHIDHSAESSMFEDGNLEEITEEIFPGVRRIKEQS